MNTAATKRWATGFAFIFWSSLAMVTASERVYWYLGGASFDSIFAVAGFYMLPTVASLWALGSGPSSRLHQVVLGGAVFGFVVEGVLTPVIYEDGPLPIMAALFVGWHGLVALVGFWYLTRKWLLEKRLRPLAIGSAIDGAYWGVWSIVYTTASAVEDFEEPFAVMEPNEFAGYALVVGITFAAAHWLLGFVWPHQFAPGKWGRRSIVVLLFGYASLAVLPAVPWAPLKFAVLVGSALWLLRRSRTKTEGEPSAVAALQGRVAVRDVAVLMIMPVVAAAAYAWTWSLELGDVAVEELFTMLSVVQMLAGAVAFGWAAWRSLRRDPTVLSVSAAE